MVLLRCLVGAGGRHPEAVHVLIAIRKMLDACFLRAVWSALGGRHPEAVHLLIVIRKTLDAPLGESYTDDSWRNFELLGIAMGVGYMGSASCCGPKGLVSWCRIL